MTSITPAGGPTTTVGLDALGRPITRTTGSSVDTYSYAGTTDTVVRIANTGGTGAVTDSIPDPSGDRLGTKTGSTVAWLTPDLHGSIAAGLAQTPSSVTDAIRYDGYGQTVAVWPSGGSPATASWKYQGRLDLSPSSIPLYAAGARDYAPGLGMFTSLDSFAGSAQDPLSMNRFLYAEANPATLVDPGGHMGCKAGKKCATASNTITIDKVDSVHWATGHWVTKEWRTGYQSQKRAIQAQVRVAAAYVNGVASPIGSIISDPVGSVVGGIETTAYAAGAGIDCVNVFSQTCLAADNMRLALWYLTEVASPEEQAAFLGNITGTVLVAKGTGRVGGLASETIRLRLDRFLGDVELPEGPLVATGEGIPDLSPIRIGPKIARQMGPRGWTLDAIRRAIASGEQVRAIDKATGQPATRYIDPQTGKSVVLNDGSWDVIQVDAPGFKHGVQGGDLR